ncbi:odorant receptor 9a-like isoform X1 [Linepithema humile]|uniref:odorant receptor 9a-like isoform X1 n=1 Tax=Linepithema humile TaxID=83485 RepID=UPI00351E0361
MVLNMPDIEVDFEWAVKLNRIALELIGLWPKTVQNSRQKLMNNLRTLSVFVGLTFFILFPAIHSLIRIHHNAMLMMDNLQFTLPGISCSIRIIIFWWKKEAIVWVVNMIAEDWIKTKKAEERSMMIKKAQNARIIITCAFCLMGFACIFIIVLPIFGFSMRLTPNITDPGRPMPIQTYYIYDVTKRPQYELTFIVQAVYIVLAIMSYTGIDNFLSLLVFHISGQLNILNRRLSYLDKYINTYDALKCCVAKHMRLLRHNILFYRTIAIIEDTYNITLLALFLYFALYFAFCGFRIINLFDKGNDMSIIHLIYFFACIVNAIVHMCLYCALGELLVGQCNEVYYAGYNNKWYSMDPKITKDLLIFLIRGNKPVYLTAGKIFPMTMATFCSLIKTSVGYISVLHTTRV